MICFSFPTLCRFYWGLGFSFADIHHSMMIFRRSDFIEILVFIVCKPRADIRIRVRRTVIRTRIDETAMRIRTVIRATDKSATNGWVPLTIGIVCSPYRVIWCNLGCYHIAISTVLNTTDAVTRYIQTLHNSLCLGDRVEYVPFMVYRVWADFSHLWFESIGIATDVDGYIIHNLPCATKEQLKAKAFVTV